MNLVLQPSLRAGYHPGSLSLRLIHDRRNPRLQELKKQGRYSVDDVVALCRQKDEGNLLGYTESLVVQLERRGQERTAEAYRTVARGLVRFNKEADIPLGQINPSLIKDYEKYLKGLGKMPIRSLSTCATFGRSTTGSSPRIALQNTATIPLPGCIWESHEQ